MLFLGDCFLVVVGTVHKTLVENTMLHRKSMAKLMIYNLYQEININLGLVLLPLSPLPSKPL